MLADSGATVLLTQEIFRPMSSQFDGTALFVDSDWATVAREPGRRAAAEQNDRRDRGTPEDERLCLQDCVRKVSVLWLPVGNLPRTAPISGDVHIRYCATDSIGDDRLRAAVSLLSDEERARHERFRVDRDRREFAVAHALLRTTLSELGDRAPDAWRFASGPHGKPMLAPDASTPPLSFNISHAHGLVACVVAAGADVGLDVERVTRPTDWRSIATRYFSPAEVAQI